MYNNFSKLTNSSKSLSMAVISLIFSLLFLFLGLKYEGKVLIGFLILALSCLFLLSVAIISFVKYKKFGDNSLKEQNTAESLELKKQFKLLTNIISILTIIFIVLLVMGFILIIL